MNSLLSLIFYVMPIILFIYFYNKNKKEKAINGNKDANRFIPDNEIKIVKHRKKISRTELTMNIGIFLIVLSSIIFATTSWNKTSDIFKALILFSEAIMFILLNFIMRKKFNLEKTANACLMIGMFIFSAFLVSIGYFKLISYKFSFFGSSKYLFVSFVMFIESLLFGISYYLYRKNSYSFLSLSSIVISFSAIMFHFTKSPDFLLLINSFILLSTFLFVEKLNNTLLSNASRIFKYVYFIIMIILLPIFLNEISLSFGESVIETVNCISITISIFLIMVSGYFVTKKVTFPFLPYYMIFISFKLDTPFILILISLVLLYIYNLLRKINKGHSRNYLFSVFVITIIATECYYCTNVVRLIIALLFLLISVLIYLFVKNDRFSKVLSSIMQYSYIGLASYVIIDLFFNPARINSEPNIFEVRFFPTDKYKALSLLLFIIGYIIFKLFKSKLADVYAIFIVVSSYILFGSEEANHIIFAFIALEILFANLIMSNCNFSKNMKRIISIVLLICISLMSKNNIIPHYSLEIIGYIIIILQAIVFEKEERIKYFFASLLYIPCYILINNLFLIESYSQDLITLTFVPFLFILFNKVFIFKKDFIKITLQSIILCIMAMSIQNNTVLLLLLLILSVLQLYKNSIKTINNNFNITGLSFIIIFAYISASTNLVNVYINLIIVMLLILSRIYLMLYNEKQNKILSYLIYASSVFIIFNFVSLLSINSEVINSFILIFALIIYYIIGNTNRQKWMSLSLLIFPVLEIISYIPLENIRIVINLVPLFIFFIILYRKIFKFSSKTYKVLEIIMFILLTLPVIVTINIVTAISLGLFAMIIYIIGLLTKDYESFQIAGAIILILNVLVQSFNIWTNIPWWAYLLVVGLVLIFVAALREKKNL